MLLAYCDRILGMYIDITVIYVYAPNYPRIPLHSSRHATLLMCIS
jgi:hypothetical protein